jgi:alpha-beta hydrolase superfamily lysophospholipase
VWDAPGSKARVVFVHGIVSHGGWYHSSCRYLAQAGIEAHFLERRGSGLNLAARGDADRRQTWLDDAVAYLESLPAGVPTVLLGISWGGKLAAALARYRPDLLAAFGMLCPGLFAVQQAGWLGRLTLRIAGAAGLRRLHVPIPLQDPALFTDSPRWRQYVRTDPLALRKVTISFALADLELNRYAAEAPEEIHVPALLMLAGRDRICDNDRTRAFFRRLGSADKTLREYADAAHTLEFEQDRGSYFEDLRAWVEKVAGPA